MKRAIIMLALSLACLAAHAEPYFKKGDKTADFKISYFSANSNDGSFDMFAFQGGVSYFVRNNVSLHAGFEYGFAINDGDETISSSLLNLGARYHWKNRKNSRFIPYTGISVSRFLGNADINAGNIFSLHLGASVPLSNTSLMDVSLRTSFPSKNELKGTITTLNFGYKVKF